MRFDEEETAIGGTRFDDMKFGGIDVKTCGE